MILSPSLLSADCGDFAGALRDLEEAGVQWVHWDVMDGRFVPNITFGQHVIRGLRKRSSLFFDVHLMMDHPLFYIPSVVRAGADLITFHVECSDSISETIDAIHQGGAKAGLVLKPGTPVETLWPWLDRIDMVLVMTVEPGFGGQKFMPAMMDKVRAIKERAPQMLIEVDGGVNDATIPQCVEAGVDICVAGTGVFRAENAEEALIRLQSYGA